MKRVNFHLEGPGEIRFISLLLLKQLDLEFVPQGKYGINMSCEKNDLEINLRPYDLANKSGGVNSRRIRDLLLNLKKTSAPLGEKNVLIIDSDTPAHHSPLGGFHGRKKYLLDLKREYDVDFEFFLIPNNSDNGNLEDLLDGLVSAEGKEFYSCLKRYTNCLAGLDFAALPRQLKDVDFTKVRFDWYTHNMSCKVSRKDSGLAVRDYLKDEIWNLESAQLSPLFNFIKAQLPTL